MLGEEERAQWTDKNWQAMEEVLQLLYNDRSRNNTRTLRGVGHVLDGTITHLENLTLSNDAEIYALKEDQAVLSKQIEGLDTNKLELENTIREQHSELRQLRDNMRWKDGTYPPIHPSIIRSGVEATPGRNIPRGH